jgi:hypothetical protein
MRAEGLRACATLHGTLRADCFEGIGYDGSVSQANFDDYSAQEKSCLSLPSADRVPCVHGMIQKYLNYVNFDAATALCAKLSPEEESRACRDSGA